MGRVFGTSATPARSAGQLRKDFWKWLADRYREEATQRDLARAPFYEKAIREAQAAADRADSVSR
jgi:hypothetical protein